MTDFIHFTNLLKKSVQKTYWGEMECFFIEMYNSLNDAKNAYLATFEKYVVNG